MLLVFLLGPWKLAASCEPGEQLPIHIHCHYHYHCLAAILPRLPGVGPGRMGGHKLNFLHTHLGIRLQIAYWIHTAPGELFALLSSILQGKGRPGQISPELLQALLDLPLIGGTPLYRGT